MTTSEVLAWLERRGSKKNVDGMARYAIRAPRVFGVSMATMKSLAKTLKGEHALAVALWKTGWFEARMLAVLIDDPLCVTSAQMDRWTRDFDNWAISDTACFHLFDKTPLAWKKVAQWAKSKREFERRAAFALIASLALHDRTAADAKFRPFLRLIERHAVDDRNFVKKGVSWALRAVGARSIELHKASSALARRLAVSEIPSARWIGKDALRDLSRPLTASRIAKRSAAAEASTRRRSRTRRT